MDLIYPFYKFHLFQVLPDIVLGLPTGLLVNGFHLYIFCTILVSGILFVCPNQLNLCALTQFIMFRCFISSSNSLLVLILQLPFFSLAGPDIFLNSIPTVTTENKTPLKSPMRQILWLLYQVMMSRFIGLRVSDIGSLEVNGIYHVILRTLNRGLES